MIHPSAKGRNFVAWMDLEKRFVRRDIVAVRRRPPEILDIAQVSQFSSAILTARLRRAHRPERRPSGPSVWPKGHLTAYR